MDNDRNEIDARMQRAEQAKLRPTYHGQPIFDDRSDVNADQVRDYLADESADSPAPPLGMGYEWRDGRPVHVGNSSTFPPGVAEPIYSRAGKEVLRAGKHYADAVDQQAAEQITDTLNFYGA